MIAGQHEPLECHEKNARLMVANSASWISNGKKNRMKSVA